MVETGYLGIICWALCNWILGYESISVAENLYTEVFEYIGMLLVTGYLDTEVQGYIKYLKEITS